MELKHSFNILLSRYTLIFKTMIYVLLVSAVCVGVMVSIMTPAMDPLIQDIENAGLVTTTTSTLMQMFLQQIDYATGMDTLSACYESLMAIIGTYRNEMLIFYILTSIVLFVYRLLTSMTSVPIASSVNKYMSSSVHTRFANDIAENFWASIKYAFFATIINQILNTALGFMTYYMIMATVRGWGIFAFTVSIFVLLLFLSFKYTLFITWVPGIVVEKKKVLSALVDSIKSFPKYFKYGFFSSIILYLFAMAATVLLGMATFFILVPVIVVAVIVMLRIIELVCYYKVNNKRYYIDHNNIISPREELY